MPGLTRWIDCTKVPSLRIDNHLFYVQTVIRDGSPAVAASCVYSPISASGDNVFVRELSNGLKMAVLAEYFREEYAKRKK